MKVQEMGQTKLVGLWVGHRQGMWTLPVDMEGHGYF